jgi:hypothetical protein
VSLCPHLDIQGRIPLRFAKKYEKSLFLTTRAMGHIHRLFQFFYSFSVKQVIRVASFVTIMYVSDMHPNPIPTNPYHIKHIAFVFCHFLLGTIISPAHELRRIWQQISQLMGITHGRDKKYFPPQILYTIKYY